jgi:hypothetical protein
MDIQRPNRTFDIDIDGEKTTITMSFALFQEVMKVIPNPENVVQVLIQDFYLREYVARRVLTGRKEVKNDDDLFDLFAHEIDDDRLDEMMLWVTDHVLYFFTSTAEKSLTLGQKYTGQIQELTQSAQLVTGSTD